MYPGCQAVELFVCCLVFRLLFLERDSYCCRSPLPTISIYRPYYLAIIIKPYLFLIADQARMEAFLPI